MNKFLKITFIFLPIFAFSLFTFSTEAAAGTIDATYKTAKFLDTDNGTINFGCTNCTISINDSGITGYAWADAQYVKIIGETGLAGLLGFIVITARLWMSTRRIYATEDDPFAKGLALGVWLGLVALLAHAVGANTFIIIRIMEPFWLCAGLVMILPRLSNAERLVAGEPRLA